MTAATLNDHRVTRARVDLRKWGCWYADVSIDGEFALSGPVTLKVADLTLTGTVLSGGPLKGRSNFTIVAGAGGWGRSIPSKSYADDGSTKASKVLGEAAAAVGETMAEVAATVRVGSGFTRPEGPASQVLQLVAPQAWYVDEAGVTRLGERAAGSLVGQVTRITPVDPATGRVELAAESIATILPGVVVDGVTAVDVCHDISPNGLRSTVWGSQQRSDLDALRSVISAQFPQLPFLGLTEYRVVTVEGNRLNLQPVRASVGMPDLRRVPVRPGVAGCSVAPTLGARVLVGFVDADRARPFVSHFEDEDGDGFQPTTLTLQAGGMAGGEHLMTVEACALLIYNVLVALMAAAGGGPLLAAVLQPLLGAAITTAISAQASPAPSGEAAQTAAAALLQAGFAAGATPSNAMFSAWTSAIAGLSSKTANVSASFPSVGCKAVEAG